MYILVLLLFLILLLLVVRPWLQSRREREMAERLKKVHDPTEASVMMDGLIYNTREESRWIERLSRWFSFFNFKGF